MPADSAAACPLPLPSRQKNVAFRRRSQLSCKEIFVRTSCAQGAAPHYSTQVTTGEWMHDFNQSAESGPRVRHCANTANNHSNIQKR